MSHRHQGWAEWPDGLRVHIQCAGAAVKVANAVRSATAGGAWSGLGIHAAGVDFCRQAPQFIIDDLGSAGYPVASRM